MTTTWILAAHRSGATVYEHTTPGSLALVREFPHPEGRMKNRELGDDRPGRSYESGGVQRSSVGSDHVPVRDIAESFARMLAATLNTARTEHKYDKLVLMAEPRFLGTLREALDPHTSATVLGSVSKDFPRVTEAEVKEHLHGLINV